MPSQNPIKILAMIPARLGSKRIPKKNLRYFGDKPLLAHAITLAKNSNLFDEVYVNSESIEIGNLAKEYHCKFYQRPGEFSTDISTNEDFVTDFLNNMDCDYIVMLNPTSPLLSENTLKKFIERIKTSKFDTIFSTVEEKAECFFQGKPLNFNYIKKINSQNIEPVEKIVWALTSWNRDTFLTAKSKGKSGIFSGSITHFSIPKDESCDLDTIEDWNIALGIYTSKQKDLYKERYWQER